MGRGQAAPAIPLSNREYEVIQRYNQKRSITHHYKIRSSIILRASKGESNQQIARDLNISYNTVKSWRKRWQHHYEQLTAYQIGASGDGVSDSELLAKILDILTDVPRSGAPKRITLSEEQQLIALACEKPEDHGIPMTQWNREMLAKVAMAEGIVEKISPRYVSELLKKK